MNKKNMAILLDNFKSFVIDSVEQEIDVDLGITDPYEFLAACLDTFSQMDDDEDSKLKS